MYHRNLCTPAGGHQESACLDVLSLQFIAKWKWLPLLISKLQNVTSSQHRSHIVTHSPAWSVLSTLHESVHFSSPKKNQTTNCTWLTFSALLYTIKNNLNQWRPWLLDQLIFDAFIKLARQFFSSTFSNGILCRRPHWSWIDNQVSFEEQITADHVTWSLMAIPISALLRFLRMVLMNDYKVGFTGWSVIKMRHHHEPHSSEGPSGRERRDSRKRTQKMKQLLFWHWWDKPPSVCCESSLALYR